MMCALLRVERPIARETLEALCFYLKMEGLLHIAMLQFAWFMNSQCSGKLKLELSVFGPHALTPPYPKYILESHHSRIGYWRTQVELRTATVKLLILYKYHAKSPSIYALYIWSINWFEHETII